MRRPVDLLLVVPLLLAPTWGQEPGGRNLLPNPSFEQKLGDAPAQWTVEPGAARARFSVAEGEGYLGGRCLRVENDTAQSPDVFGRLVRNVRLQEGTTYTLSCYVKSADPGAAWLGTGKDWKFRFAIPASSEWMRVVGVFVADASELPVMFVTESPTSGILVDDMQLELGDIATPFAQADTPAPGTGRLSILPVGLGATGANLVANSAFEEAEGELPAGWGFSPRNTDATAILDDAHAHTGKRSLRLRNGTAFGAHVYGQLVYGDPVEVEPSTMYTLSCYYRSLDSGIAWIGGGPGWTVRLNAPQTKGEWRRVSTTFQTGADQHTFDLMVCTESPTEGIWLDDAKLERGAFATPCVPETGATDASLIVDLPKVVPADDVLVLSGWLAAPSGGSAVRLEGRLTSPEGTLAEDSVAISTGLSEVRFAYGLPEAPARDCRVDFRLLDAGGAVLSETAAEFVLVSSGENRSRIATLRQTAADLRARLEALRANGLDVAYPLVSLTVLEQFAAFVEEDNSSGWIPRAATQLDDLALTAERCRAEVERLEGGMPLPAVPRYTTSPIGIADGAFRAGVAWPDGRTDGDWPLYFTGYGHFNAVKRDIELMPAYGMNIIQIELGPMAVMPDENTIDRGPIEDYLRIFDRAAAAGVSINLLLSPHYMPQWAYDKWPEIGGVDGGFIRFSVDSPHTREVLERFLRAVVPEFANHPALHSFCLSNEPIYRNATRDPENRPAYSAWLLRRYGTLEAVANAHGATYASVDDVPVMPAPDGTEVTARARYDYYRFNNERFAGWHRWMADIVHEIAPDVPVHAKPMNTVFSLVNMDMGVDPEQFCDFSQIAGNDCWKWYSGNRNGYASEWLGENMYFDLQRSISGLPIFNSENHVIVDRERGEIPPAHIRNIIWQAAIHGEGASTMWVWERSFDDKSDFAGSIMHRPECADAHGRTGLDLLRLGHEVNALETSPARVALVYSIASLIYGMDYERTLARTYEALNFTGEKIDFLTERQLANGDAAQYGLVIAAGCSALPEDAFRALEEYAANGGRVLAIGPLSLTRDDFDQPRAWADPDTLTRIEEATARELRPALLAELANAPGDKPVQALDPATGEPVWGVEVRSAALGDATLVNLTNHLSTPVKLRLGTLPPGTPIDRFREEPCPEVIELQPLEVLLVSVGGDTP